MAGEERKKEAPSSVSLRASIDFSERTQSCSKKDNFDKLTSSNKAKVLLVDDDAFNHFALKQILKIFNLELDYV